MEGRHRGHRIDFKSHEQVPNRLSGQGTAPDRHAECYSRSSDERSVPKPSPEVVILIPSFNDWDSLAELLPRLDAVLSAHDTEVDILVVDDGSTTEPEEFLVSTAFRALRRVDVLRLRRNLGHQRAIAIGLAYVEDCLQASVVVVMDGDGEDDPADVPRLLARLEEEGNGRVVFAERSRRSESHSFRTFYALYKFLHRVLTGKGVRVGNFSAIPRGRLSSLVVVSDLWNHYAAAVIRSRQPHCLIPTCRSVRLCGRSTMNFVSLVVHGLSAISVYSDVVGVRLLVMSALLALSDARRNRRRGDRATDDGLGHPRLGELHGWHPGDSSRPGDLRCVRLQLCDPGLAAWLDLSAPSGLFLLHRVSLDASRARAVCIAVAGYGALKRGPHLGEMSSKCPTFMSARSSICSRRLCTGSRTFATR